MTAPKSRPPRSPNGSPRPDAPRSKPRPAIEVVFTFEPCEAQRRHFGNWLAEQAIRHGIDISALCQQSEQEASA